MRLTDTVKNKLSLEVSIGIRVPGAKKAAVELQPIGAFTINCSDSDPFTL